LSSGPLKFEVTSEAKYLPDVRARLRRWAADEGWSERQVGEIVLALDEAVTNVIRHAYNSEPQHRILVYAEPIVDPEHGAGCEIRVRDFGRQVDPGQICGRDLDDVRPGGLGVHIIRAMNSVVEYQRAEGGGMLLVMRKYRTHTAGCGEPAAE
jgi:serine/threonine-protein kinase RsbW